ncbi:MAG: efflux RND transporter permease subunit [Thermodesulfobacteriota bacterium]
MTAVHKKFENWFARLAALVYRHRYAALLFISLLTAALAGQMTKLTIDTRDESFFGEDDPALIAYNGFRDTFGQDDMFIISMRPHHGLTRDFLATLTELHHQLEAKVPYLADITSLVNGRIVYGQGDTLVVDELMPEPPRTEAERELLLAQIDRYPLYEKLLVSTDRSMTSILIKAQAVKPVAEKDLLAGFADDAPSAAPAAHRYLSNEESIEISRAISQVVADFQGRGIDFHLSGTPLVVAELTSTINDDLRTMVPLSFLLIVLFLAVLFRRISGVLYPLLIVLLSLIATLGLMGLCRIPITMVMQILPSFLVVVGIGDSVHILTIFYRLYRRSGDKEQAIVQAMGFAGLPVLMTSVTTACGLLSFAWADLHNVAQLGYMAPAGVMLALLYTVVLLPALIAIFPISPGRHAATARLPLADRIFTWIAAVTTRRPLLICLISAIMVSLALWSALSVRFAHNALTWFPRDSPTRVATELLDRVNGGTVMLEALVDTGRETGLHEPDLQRRLSEAAQTIPTLEAHGIRAAKAWSLADVLKETNRALHEGRDEAYRVPESRELIAQELILFESGGSDDLEDIADSTYRTGRLSILAPWTDAVLYKDYIDRVSDYLASQFPHEEVRLTGHIVLFMQIIKKVITSMAKSYAFALVVISLLMVLLVGRVRIGLLSMIPNVVPIIFILGLMGRLAIPLDLSTMLIGSIVLGLVVDDTIHFLHHFRRAFEESGEVETAVRETMLTTGRAMVITSIVLCGGFFIYTTAYLASSVRYGLLTGSAVLFALAADFFLVPALLSLVSLNGPTGLTGLTGPTGPTGPTGQKTNNDKTY